MQHFLQRLPSAIIAFILCLSFLVPMAASAVTKKEFLAAANRSYTSMLKQAQSAYTAALKSAQKERSTSLQKARKMKSPKATKAAQANYQLAVKKAKATLAQKKQDAKQQLLDAKDEAEQFDEQDLRAYSPPSSLSPLTPPAPSQGGGSDQVAQLLLSSGWCSFSYSGSAYSGGDSSSSSRVQFSSDGTLTISKKGESYSSGYGGLEGGYSSGAETAQWRTDNNRLYINGADASLEVNRNSSGYIFLKAFGVEYSQCQ